MLNVSPWSMMKAVSARLFSAAIFCIISSGRGWVNMQTAAGLPPKSFSVKASTWNICIFISKNFGQIIKNWDVNEYILPLLAYMGSGMMDTCELTFPALFAESVKNFGERNFIAMVGEKPKTYSETHKEIQALIALFEQLGINPGDKVAILGTNMPNWVVSFFAITFTGAIAV